MLTKWFCLLVVALVLPGAWLQEVDFTTRDYCDSNLCPKFTKHIGCKHNGDFGKACPPDVHTVDIDEKRSLILSRHNWFRNRLAAGQYPDLLVPERMGTLMWEEELAALAELKAKDCTTTHDVCHNTKAFPNAGQNIDMITMQGLAEFKRRTDDFLLLEIIDMWWDQWENATKAKMANFPSDIKTGDALRNFAVMARENNTRMGCGAVRFTRGTKYHFLLACNYASNLEAGQATYRAKPLTCQSGYDKNYVNLCSYNEHYEPVVETMTPRSFSLTN